MPAVDAVPWTDHAALRHELRDEVLNDVDRNGEVEVLALPSGQRVDPDHHAAEVDQRSTGLNTDRRRGWHTGASIGRVSSSARPRVVERTVRGHAPSPQSIDSGPFDAGTREDESSPG